MVQLSPGTLQILEITNNDSPSKMFTDAIKAKDANLLRGFDYLRMNPDIQWFNMTAGQKASFKDILGKAIGDVDNYFDGKIDRTTLNNKLQNYAAQSASLSRIESPETTISSGGVSSRATTQLSTTLKWCNVNLFSLNKS